MLGRVNGNSAVLTKYEKLRGHGIVMIPILVGMHLLVVCRRWLYYIVSSLTEKSKYEWGR